MRVLSNQAKLLRPMRQSSLQKNSGRLPRPFANKRDYESSMLGGKGSRSDGLGIKLAMTTCSSLRAPAAGMPWAFESVEGGAAICLSLFSGIGMYVSPVIRLSHCVLCVSDLSRKIQADCRDPLPTNGIMSHPCWVAKGLAATVWELSSR